MALSKEDTIEISLSNSTAFEYIRALVYGPPGAGKTFSTLTLSDAVPADFGSKPVLNRAPVTLEDMLWLSFDSGATEGLKQQGLIVPELRLAQEGDRLLAVIKEAPELAAKAIATKGTKTVVVDTITAFDEQLVNYWRTKGLEKWDLFGAVKSSHYKFAMAIKALKANVVFIAHAKALMDAADATQSAKIQAAGYAKIVPDITGGALNHYRRDSSFILPCVAGRENNEDGRWFYTQSTKGYEAKSRYVLPPVVPADWRKIKLTVS